MGDIDNTMKDFIHAISDTGKGVEHAFDDFGKVAGDLGTQETQSQGATTANTSSPSYRMSTELFLNFLAIRMNSRKAEGLRFTMNLVTPENGEKFIVELENATLTIIKGFQAEKPD